MAAPLRIDELPAVTSLSTGAAIAIVQGGITQRTTAAAFINQAESFTQPGNGATSEAIQTVLRNAGKMVTSFGATGDDSADDTAEFQACADALSAGGLMIVPHGKTYKLTDVITLSSFTTVLNFGTIKQYTTDKGVFKATSKDRVHIVNYGLIYGPGVWSSGWTGNGGHEERGVQFLGCTRSSVTGPGVIRNFGHAGVACYGGNGIKIHHKIEGTEGYGSDLSVNDNFQHCVYLADDTTYGSPQEIDIDIDGSGSAMGVLYEHPTGTTDNAGSVRIRGHIHDIPGQHAVYVQNGNLDIDISVKDLALSAVKIQSPLDGQNIKSFKAHVTGNNIDSHVFEVATLGTGSIADLKLSCAAQDLGGSALSMSGKTERLEADLVCDTANNVFLASGANQNEISVKLNGKTITTDGVLISSTTSAFKIYPTLRLCNVGSDATSSGIRINSASATVDIYNPDVTDASNEMIYGLFNSVAGGVVRVHGSATFTGAATGNVRATGKITEWPSSAVLDGATTGLSQISSSQPLVTEVQTPDASNVTLWVQTLDDESSYIISADITGKLAGGAQRAVYRETLCAYRNGAGSVQEGATDTDVSIASASFAGAHSWVFDTNEVYLRVNSGGAATVYDWTARVTVTKVAD